MTEAVAKRSTTAGAHCQCRHFDAYTPSNRTCEIGMTRATGRPYESIINALARATQR